MRGSICAALAAVALALGAHPALASEHMQGEAATEAPAPMPQMQGGERPMAERGPCGTGEAGRMGPHHAKHHGKHHRMHHGKRHGMGRHGKHHRMGDRSYGHHGMARSGRGYQPGRHGGGMRPGLQAMMSPQMMTMMFILADTDGNATLSLEEVLAVETRFFKHIDANNDGEMTQGELRGFMRQMMGGGPRGAGRGQDGAASAGE